MKEKKKNIYKWIAALCIVLFLVCIVWLLNYYRDLKEAQRQMDELRESYVSSVSESAVPEAVVSETAVSDNAVSENDVEEEKIYPGLEGFNVPAVSIDFPALYEENDDIYAWIMVPGTQIDYPVLQHPGQTSYYLDHNIDDSRGYPGCIFTEFYNSKDFEDPNTVIYGHNMKNGSMFAGLHYFEDSQFFDENQFIYIFSEEHTYVYRIFAAYEFSNIHLVQGFNLDDPDVFEQYLDGIFQLDGINNNFREDIELTAKDRIITLTTCISDKPDKRYLVQGVLVAIG
ncbi:MAG: class B sortase [Lachnospiraceae bacterium]